MANTPRKTEALIFCSLAWESLIYTRLMAQDRKLNHRLLPSLVFPAPTRKHHPTPLRFTPPPINILKSCLIEIKTLQHSSQHHYVLLWQLQKCHKYEPKSLLHEEYLAPPHLPLFEVGGQMF